jgi:hypothetical protein
LSVFLLKEHVVQKISPFNFVGTLYIEDVQTVPPLQLPGGISKPLSLKMAKTAVNCFPEKWDCF